MKLPKPLVIAIVVAIVLLAVRVGVTLIQQPSDQAQIEAALAESIKASKEGRPGGVLDKLSNRLLVNDMETSGNRSQIADYIKQNRPDVYVKQKRATITGDRAEIVSPVDIELNVLGQTRTLNLDEVKLIFRKEDDHLYLVIPTQRWKLAEVRVADSALSNFAP